MSVDELTSMYSSSNDGGAPGGGGGHDRLPPQDVGAEQSVLGGMLLSKDAIADVAEEVRGHDFYRPAHELIYDAIVDLYSRGEPADAITVADELGKRGDLQRAGGQAYLHDLIQSVPTAANAGYYAQIVAERAVLRRLVDAGTRIVQLGYAQGGGDVEDIVNQAQAEVYQVADKRGGEDYVALGETLEETLNEIEVAAGRGGEMIGVPTGFTDLDELTHGLHPGQMIVIAARPAVGKALALDTPLPTPEGWTTMGDVAVGDALLGADGRPTRVVAVTDVMHDRPCFEVEFSDGSVIVADAEHQWLTHTRASRRARAAAGAVGAPSPDAKGAPAVRTTADIAATLRTATGDRRLNHSVALAAPLDLPDAPLDLPPYVVGAWLGDGTSACAAITTADDDMVMLLEGQGLVVTPLAAQMRYSLRLPEEAVETRQCQECHNDHGTVHGLLRKIGVLGDKHIPAAYQRASERQRRELLAGLLDTDGTVTHAGSPQFTTTSERLYRDVHELIVGLGYRCGVSRKTVRGRTEQSSTAYTLTFTSDEDVFWLERKRLLHKERRPRTFQRRDSRFITAVRPIASVPVRCLQVDNGDHLFLAGPSMIPTHNSTMGIDIARSAAIKHGMATAVFSLEMSRSEITMRVLSAEAQIQLQDLRKGTLGDPGWQKLARIMGKISESPLFIDDSPNMSLMEIRAKARRLKQQHNLKLIVLDYLQLMSSGKKVESRQQEVAEFSRALKLLAKELEVPVIAISQLNRGSEQRTDKRPQMSDLRESGSIEQDADMVILLHRDRTDPEREGEADVIVAKHRNGPTADIVLAWQGHYSRFANMAKDNGF
ncbi:MULTISPECIES: replicative DNA helicase [unclassified Janibacter]|uniref:replicative DNA helicase n=1 Tax=unclassified Janibacter TaxID=2649294 RepID=UPI003D06D4B5